LVTVVIYPEGKSQSPFYKPFFIDYTDLFMINVPIVPFLFFGVGAILIAMFLIRHVPNKAARVISVGFAGFTF
jgi:tellurite resistance protein TehA-like permease